MKISYYRMGGRVPPRDNEQLEIGDDGGFTLWRSVGWATRPPAPVGRFAGRLDEAQNRELRRQAEAAAAAGDLEILPKPDSPVETVSLEGPEGLSQAKLGIHDEPNGPWGLLVTRLRALLGELTAFPRGAIALEVLPGGQQARLVHRGQEPVQIDLSKLKVRAVRWVDYVNRGDWFAEPDEPDEPVDAESDTEVTAEPGWSMNLPFDHGFEIEEVRDGNRIAAYVSFEVLEDDWPVPVSLEASTSEVVLQ